MPGTSQARPRVAIVWDNFGPQHVDRIKAATDRLRGRYEVVGVELFSSSDTYSWRQVEVDGIRRLTLFPGGKWLTVRALQLSLGIVRAARMMGCKAVFLSHYQVTGILLAAIVLRLIGVSVFTIGCSKYDDFPRYALREWFKRFYFKPYHGAIGSRFRSTDYFRFLGVPEGMIEGGYNTVSHDRIRVLAEAAGGAEVAYADRAFLCVARMVPKKNHKTLLAAYASYVRETPAPRRLILCGNGPEEEALRQQANLLGIHNLVEFNGFVQAEAGSRLMRDALCLILPSLVEQFGNVVPEAQAVDCPVLISTPCGAADELVRSGVNGHIFEPDNVSGLADLLVKVGSDEAHWRHLREGVAQLRPAGNASVFAASVETLLERIRLRN